MDLLADADLPVLAAGLGLMVLSLTGLLALLVRRRRARAVDAAPAQSEAAPEPADAEPVDAEPADAEPAGVEPAQSEAEGPGRSLEVRTLRAQVHCLEQALARVPEPAEASYRVQVRATLRAVAADCAPGADPRYVLDRLVAAIDRLDQPGGLTRPTLPGPRVAALSTVATQEVRHPVALESAPEAAEPAEPTEPVEPVEPEAAAEPDEDELVVPVPPPALVEPRRQRRRLRRSAA